MADLARRRPARPRAARLRRGRRRCFSTSAVNGWRSVYPRWSDVVLIGARRRRVRERRDRARLLDPAQALAPALPDGEVEAERWEAFRRYLTDFPRLQEAPPATLALWERFLVYGITFGIADRVLQAAHLAMPEALARGVARSTGSRPAATSAAGRARSASATSPRVSARLSLPRPPARAAGAAASRAAAEAEAAAGAAAGPGDGQRRVGGDRARGSSQARPLRQAPGRLRRARWRPAAATFSDSASPGIGIARDAVTGLERLGGQALALGAEQDRHRGRRLRVASETSPRAARATTRPGRSSHGTSGTRKIAPALARSAFCESGSAHPVGQRHGRAERVRRPDQRADVAGVGRAARARGRCRAGPPAGRRGGRRRSPGEGAAGSTHPPAAPARRSRPRRAARRARSPPPAPRRRDPRPHRRRAPSRPVPSSAAARARASASRCPST